MPTFILGFVGLGLELALLVILTRRRLYHRFPAFLAYSAWTICVMAIRLCFGGHPYGFFLAFWLTEASYLVLALAVMLSLLKPIITELTRRRPLTAYISPSACLVLFGLALWAAFFKPMGATALGHFTSGIYVFVSLICLFEVLLFVVTAVIKQRYGVEWTRYEAGILAGFGILALITLFARLPGLLTIFHFNVGPQLEALFRYFPSGAFISSALAWLIAFWRPEPPTKDRPPTAPHKYRELARVIRDGVAALKEFARRLGFDLAAIAETPSAKAT